MDSYFFVFFFPQFSGKLYKEQTEVKHLVDFWNLPKKCVQEQEKCVPIFPQV